MHTLSLSPLSLFGIRGRWATYTYGGCGGGTSPNWPQIKQTACH